MKSLILSALSSLTANLSELNRKTRKEPTRQVFSWERELASPESSDARNTAAMGVTACPKLVALASNSNLGDLERDRCTSSTL